MKGKTALVLGGSGGIGLEVANSMLNAGFRVCAAYHNNRGKLGELQAELQASNKKQLSTKQLSAYQFNLPDANSVKLAFSKMLKEHPRIDVVVYSVTFPIKNKHILNADWADFNEHLELQTKGLFNVVQILKEQIRSGYKTKFIIISTEYCIGKPPAGLSHYISARYSLLGLAKSMAVELAKYNCTVNIISPGMTETGLISALPPKLVEMTAENNPLKRIATPKDVANVVLFLSSEKSDYLNGVNITVNGGGVML